MFDEYYMTKKEYQESGQAAIDAQLKRDCDDAANRMSLDYFLDEILDNLYK